MLRLLSPNNVLEPELKSMGRDLSPFFLLPSLDLLSRQMSHGTDWRPSADILEHTDGYRIVVELPGVTRDDVNVSMDKGVLTISGERKRMMEDETSSKDANAGFRDGHVWHRLAGPGDLPDTSCCRHARKKRCPGLFGKFAGRRVPWTG